MSESSDEDWFKLVAGGYDRQTQTCVISELNSAFVLPGNHHHDYQHSHLDLSALTPKLGKNAC